VLSAIGEVELVQESLSDAQSEINQPKLAWIVAKADAANAADTVLTTMNDEAIEMLVRPTQGIWSVVCKSATLLSLGTSKRRQISGLTPRRTTRSWKTWELRR